jgi:predicted ATP-dependent endonuclease of OLD family
MRVASFQIKNYKVIGDTGRIKADNLVTALVGKNESGKSSVMKAMWKSRNVADAKFDKLYDYPRDRYSRDRKLTQEVTIIDFGLTSEEVEALAEQFPEHSLVEKPKHVIITTSYQGEDKVGHEITFDKEVNSGPLAAEARSVIEAVATAIVKAGGEDAAAVQTALTSARAEIDIDTPSWRVVSVKVLETFSDTVTTWVGADAARQTVAVAERERLQHLLTQVKQGDPTEKARTWAEQNLPIFIYFDNYGLLETRIHLPLYLQRKDAPDAKVRTQTALFEWSGIDPQEILDLGRPRQNGETDEEVHRRHEKRRALLDSSSFSLTGDWVQWWTEKRHKMHFDADGEDLVLRVSDQHNEFPLPFEERSHGLQWFFSFYLVFLVESRKAHRGAILLLDEPGLHLHPTLQTKLIELFERISAVNQLIYSTHLPFLVDGNHLERVRTVHLAGAEPQKTIISNDVRPTGDRDTLFPLQAAVGYSIAQTLFLGRRSVIVEGITDYWIMKALSDCLSTREAGPALHPDTVLIPAGGTSRLMPLASIMLASAGIGERHLLVLLDSDKEGDQAAKRLKDVFSAESAVLMLGSVIGLAGATIEDLLPRSTYIAALKQAGYDITLNAGEKGATTTIKAIEQAFDRKKMGKFGMAEKAAAALALIDGWGKDPSTIPGPTREKAGALFDAINRHFDELP